MNWKVELQYLVELQRLSNDVFTLNLILNSQKDIKKISQVSYYSTELLYL